MIFMVQETKIGSKKSEKKMNENGGYSRRKGKLGKPVIIASTMAIVIFILILTFSPTTTPVATRDNLPANYKFNPNTEAAYLFMVDHQYEGQYIACYCGCKNYPHNNLKECFIQENGRWQGHGVTCEICVHITLDLKVLLANGTTLLEARNILDARYKDQGPGTETPLPP